MSREVTEATPEEAQERTRRIGIYRNQINRISIRLEHGVDIIKPGHRVQGVNGSGREATHIIAVPLTDRQRSNLGRHVAVLQRKLTSVQGA